MPPLRERAEDIPIIAEHFRTQFNKPGVRAVSGISNSARRALIAYSWPGNVRELRNVIEYAVIVGLSPSIEREDLPDTLSQEEPAPGVPGTYHVRVREAKKRIIEEALAATGWSYREAAAVLDVHPNNLHRMIRELGLRRP